MKRKRSFARRFLWRLFALALLVVALLLVRRGLVVRERRQLASAGMPIVPLYQYDYPEAVCTIGGKRKSVATSGCGAVCMSMVIDYLTGDDRQTPRTLFEEAYRNGDYGGYGLSHEALSRMGAAHGVAGSWVGGEEDVLRSALAEGHPVIAHMGPGAFTRDGHYILLRGLAPDGRVLVNDPNSERRTWSAWPLEKIISEAKGASPFMVCAKKSRLKTRSAPETWRRAFLT